MSGFNFNPPVSSSSGWGAAVPGSGGYGGGGFGSGSGNGNNEGASATPLNDEDDYGDLVADILGEVGKKEEGQLVSPSTTAGNKKLGTKVTEQKPHLLLDFRRGASDWPEGVEVCTTCLAAFSSCLCSCMPPAKWDLWCFRCTPASQPANLDCRVWGAGCGVRGVARGWHPSA